MKRYRTTEEGYRFDKVIFFFCLVVIIVLAFSVMYANSFDFNIHPYFKCNQIMCENPFVQLTDCKQSLNVLWVIPIYSTGDCKQDCTWCDEKLLPYGEYGTKPKLQFFLDNMFWIDFFIVVLAFVLNHYIHNKGKWFDIEIPITEKFIINKRKIREWSRKVE